jgi:heptosyltransferase-1/heptosyltransferase-2
LPAVEVRNVLAVELAGLGDLIHSLPALWAVRRAWPAARMHCIVREHNASLLRLVPWIDHVIPYRRSFRAGTAYQLSTLRELRRQRFDLAVDFMGSDYSAALAALSGATRRLIRRPGTLKRRWCWRLAATDLMIQPFDDVPMYRQRLGCIEAAGFSTYGAHFGLSQPFDDSESHAAERPIIHVSPFTRRSYKELPPEQMAALLTRIHERWPDHALVVSCSRAARELTALSVLLAALPFKLDGVHAGDLDIPTLLGLIGKASVHVGGDTGTIHLAWLAETPSVSWFRQSAKLAQWAPSGAQHSVLTAPDMGGADHLRGIDTDAVLERIAERLAHAQRSTVQDRSARGLVAN